jgi:predicted transcriptional regulator
MKKPIAKEPRPAKSFSVRLSAEIADEVARLAAERRWSFSKTLGVLVELAIAAKVLKS